MTHFTKLGKRLESATRKALFDYDLLSGAANLGIALSGGKDSVTLLFMLKAILGKGFPPLKLIALHVDGSFSCGPGVAKGHLQKLCDQLKVPLVTSVSTRSLEELKCYPCSRERRRLLFDAAKAEGISHIAFGHHSDDAAQTLLLNLLHKGEFATMLPKLEMVDYGIHIIRPLILIKESEIRTFAQKEGFARMTCQCPVGQKSMRKKVDQLLIRMEDHFPHARANLALAGRLYGSDKARKNKRDASYGQ